MTFWSDAANIKVGFLHFGVRLICSLHYRLRIISSNEEVTFQPLHMSDQLDQIIAVYDHKYSKLV